MGGSRIRLDHRSYVWGSQICGLNGASGVGVPDCGSAVGEVTATVTLTIGETLRTSDSESGAIRGE